jgi:hypothetical protein
MTTLYQSYNNTGDPVWIVATADGKTIYATEQAARTALQELIMAERLTAAQEWEADLRDLISTARTLITQANALSILAQTNDITGTITGTADGALLAGTTITKEDAALRAALFAEMQTWLLDGTPSRLALVFRRF